jgi:hypothetical protein
LKELNQQRAPTGEYGQQAQDRTQPNLLNSTFQQQLRLKSLYSYVAMILKESLNFLWNLLIQQLKKQPLQSQQQQISQSLIHQQQSQQSKDQPRKGIVM